MISEKQIKSFIVIFCSLVAASCSLHTLPDDWSLPKSVSGSGCPDISGTYSATGTCSDKDSKGLKKDSYIGQKYWMDATHFTVHLTVHQQAPGEAGCGSSVEDDTDLTIDQQDQTSLLFTAYKGKYVLYSKELSMKPGDFSCEDGWIKFSKSEGGLFHGTMTLGVGGYWTYNRFARTGEYLLMEVGDMATALVAVTVPIPIPYVYASSDWCKYPILNTTEGPTSKEEEKNSKTLPNE